MIGKLKKMWYGQCKYGCCYMRTSKTMVKRHEEALAYKEAEEEMAHGDWCGDYYCKECGGEDFDYYDASELDGIKGVWTDTARLIY